MREEMKKKRPRAATASIASLAASACSCFRLVLLLFVTAAVCCCFCFFLLLLLFAVASARCCFRWLSLLPFRLLFRLDTCTGIWVGKKDSGLPPPLLLLFATVTVCCCFCSPMLLLAVATARCCFRLLSLLLFRPFFRLDTCNEIRVEKKDQGCHRLCCCCFCLKQISFFHSSNQ
jgi:hypothetical protein